MKVADRLPSGLARFLLVTIAGVLVDMGVGYGLRYGLGVHLGVAASLGLLAGAAFNYAMHERWTFGVRRVPSLRRILTFMASVTIVWLVRLGVVAALDDRLADCLVLPMALGMSFVANFAIARAIFRDRNMHQPQAPKGSAAALR